MDPSRKFLAVKNVILVMLLTLEGGSHGQENTCLRCSGNYRFEPQIIDLIIKESANDDTINATIYWDEPPACCDVDYQVDVFSVSRHGVTENCSIAVTNISKTDLTLHLSESEVFIFQINAIYEDSIVTPGPCHIVNATSYITNSRTYWRKKNMDVNIPIVFDHELCGLSIFQPPAYQLNGMVLHGSELNEYITFSEEDGYHFILSNVTRDYVLLEYCDQLTEALCDTCEHPRQDIFLSRTEVSINGNCSPPNAPRGGFLEEVTSTTLMFGCNEGYSPQGTTTAVCVANDTWSPDPALLECSSISTTDSSIINKFETVAVIASSVVGVFIFTITLAVLGVIPIILVVRRRRWKTHNCESTEVPNSKQN